MLKFFSQFKNFQNFLYCSQRDNAELDPHIYSIANSAFTNMTRFGQDQSIIVTGESGAGKTVSAKFSMKFFAAVGGTNSKNNKGDSNY